MVGMRLRALGLALALCLGWIKPSHAIVDLLSELFVSDQQVTQLGEQGFEEIKQQQKISQDLELQRLVKKMGQRIVRVASTDIPPEQWEFVVFDSPEVNAFALPGGHVGVYTGLIDIAENEDQLAAVIGHEIAHVTEGHVKERLTTSMGTSVGVALLAGWLAGDSGWSDELASILGVGTEYGVARPFGRGQETEADVVGLRYMADAGYDPRAAVSLWQNMMQAKGAGGGLPAWLSTHPADQARIERLEEELTRMGY